MSKAEITPLLKSIIKKTDKYPYLGITMDDVDSIISNLTDISEKTKVKISHYVAAKSSRIPHIYLTGNKDYSTDITKVQNTLNTLGFKVVKSRKGDSDSWNIDFVRNI